MNKASISMQSKVVRKNWANKGAYNFNESQSDYNIATSQSLKHPDNI